MSKVVDLEGGMTDSSTKDSQLTLDFGSSVKPAPVPSPTRETSRYKGVTERKATGATYTPRSLAKYLATHLVRASDHLLGLDAISILDPALGDGVLVDELLCVLESIPRGKISVTAYETDRQTAQRAIANLAARHPGIQIHLNEADFLENWFGRTGTSYRPPCWPRYDLIIANPPYVRTQVLGSDKARTLADRFGLEGRVDLYHAFLLAMADQIAPEGRMAVITSNRFMTTRGATALRRFLWSRLEILRIWDLGDTKLFDATVLPAMILARRSRGQQGQPPIVQFTSAYEVRVQPNRRVPEIVSVLDDEGVFETSDSRRFNVVQGLLNAGNQGSDVWRLSTHDIDLWLRTVERNTWAPLRALGRVRVGVKTTADRVFIRKDWLELPEEERPELLRPLITHHVGSRYRGKTPTRQVLYPHLVRNGVRIPADLNQYPRSARYLEQHRRILESRTYVIDAGRRWYEIWVPQDPAAWSRRKLVFRDISEKPVFWIDEDGCVVNGDCYWLLCEEPVNENLLWLAAAVCNSSFIEEYYDKKFNNKLYAGRRRFISQYVENFPLPSPDTPDGRHIIELASFRYNETDAARQRDMESELDQCVWRSFGVSPR